MGSSRLVTCFSCGLNPPVYGLNLQFSPSSIAVHVHAPTCLAILVLALQDVLGSSAVDLERI